MYRDVSKCNKDLNPPFADPRSAFSRQGQPAEPADAGGPRPPKPPLISHSPSLPLSLWTSRLGNT
eukprot:16451578-Heterocapsa_arctica.AAC.1